MSLHRRRRGRGRLSVAGDPVLIGAVTVLIAVCATFLAYNANNGLPLVPKYTLRVTTPTAAGLFEGQDVRLGGEIVGRLSEVRPVLRDDGAVWAALKLNVDKDLEPLASDTTIKLRARSVLGGKYVELIPGRSATPLEGDEPRITLPAGTRPPVELDDTFNVYDRPTRAGIQGGLRSYSDAFAGRGTALQQTIADLPRFLELLEPAMANLASQRTDLAGFVDGFARFVAASAVVAEDSAAAFAGLDTTFAAFAAERDSMTRAIQGAPPLFEAATTDLPRQAPLMAETTQLIAQLRPGLRALRTGADDLGRAATAGPPGLEASIGLEPGLVDASRSIGRYARDARVTDGLTSISSFTGALTPTVATLRPAQTICNYLGILFRNLASVLDDGTSYGHWLSAAGVISPEGLNSEGKPSSSIANGQGNPTNVLHANPRPNFAGPGQPRECEAGREPWLSGRPVIGNLPGNQGVETEDTGREEPRG